MADAKALSKALKQHADAVKPYLLPAIANATFHTAVNQERFSQQISRLVDFYQTLVANVWKRYGVPFVEVNGEQCLPLVIDDFKNMKTMPDKTGKIWDIGFTRSLVGIELQGLFSTPPQISLRRNGEPFFNIHTTTEKTVKAKKRLLRWPPEKARYVKVSAASSVTPTGLVGLKKPATYACVRKTSTANEWKTDAYWKDVAMAENFVNRRQGFSMKLFLSRWRTTAQATYDASNLYIRMACYFPDAKMLEYNQDKTLQSATPIWENDCVQIFVKPVDDTQMATDSFSQVIVNVGGKIFTRRHHQEPLPVNITVDCKIFRDHWVCVMAIPLAWFNARGKALEGQTWKINFARTQRYPVPDFYSGYSSWAMLPPGTMLWFLQPNYFGTLRFENPKENIKK